MRRVELLVLVSGCMRVYPDPELPDVTVRWFDDSCENGDLEAVVALTGVDDPAFHDERSVPCSDLEVAFVDVPRQRFQLATALRHPGGAAFGSGREDLDLRAGLDEETYAFFTPFDNVRVGLAFEPGTTCESLAADFIEVDFAPDAPALFGACGAAELTMAIPPGTYTARARAVSGRVTVASSPESAAVVVDFAPTADFGTLVMSPCADRACVDAARGLSPGRAARPVGSPGRLR